VSVRLYGSSGNDSIATPRWLFDRLDAAFRFDLDAFSSHANHLAAFYSTAAGTFVEGRKVWIDPREGFEFPWSGLGVFANPPYSRLMDAVAKFEREVESARWIAMLVKWDTSTKWAQRLEECAIVQPLKRRIPYVHPDPPPGWSGATFASALAFPRRDWSAVPREGKA